MSKRIPGPALETAIIVEETELLEIGVSSYRRYLADGVKERTRWAVAVLKATSALVSTAWWGFPTVGCSAPPLLEIRDLSTP